MLDHFYKSIVESLGPIVSPLSVSLDVGEVSEIVKNVLVPAVVVVPWWRLVVAEQGELKVSYEWTAVPVGSKTVVIAIVKSSALENVEVPRTENAVLLVRGLAAAAGAAEAARTVAVQHRRLQHSFS